jgi:hypothetical protein
MFARRPRSLRGWISGEGGVGGWLGERGYGMLDKCEIILLGEDRPLRNGHFGVVVIRWRNIETEDWDVE